VDCWYIFYPKYCIFYLSLPLPFRKSTIHLFVNFNIYRCRSKFWYWTRWCWFRSTWSRTGKISKTHKMKKHCYFAFISGAYWLSILSHEVKYPISPSVVSCVKMFWSFLLYPLARYLLFVKEITLKIMSDNMIYECWHDWVRYLER
jgi:hypothetical protein